MGDDGNGNGDRVEPARWPQMGSEFSPELCLAYREAMKADINHMGDTIKNTVWIAGATTALILSLVQLALHFYG